MIHTPFDAYEISMVHEISDGRTGEAYCERCECEPGKCPSGNLVRTYWSLYGHIHGQGCECIGDYTNEDHARSILARILGRDLDGEQSPFPLIYGVDS